MIIIRLVKLYITINQLILLFNSFNTNNKILEYIKGNKESIKESKSGSIHVIKEQPNFITNTSNAKDKIHKSIKSNFFKYINI